jgi:hypothetical protein
MAMLLDENFSEKAEKLLLRRNCKQAVMKIQKALEETGWDIQDNVKVPFATKGSYRIWFKDRGLYFTIEPHVLSEARFLWVDPQKICEMNPKRISKGLVGLIRKMSVQGR